MFAFESWFQFTTPESYNIHEGTDKDECVPFRVAFQVTNSQRRAWHPKRKDTVEEQNSQAPCHQSIHCSHIPPAFGNSSLQPTSLHGISPNLWPTWTLAAVTSH